MRAPKRMDLRTGQWLVRQATGSPALIRSVTCSNGDVVCELEYPNGSKQFADSGHLRRFFKVANVLR